MRSLDICGCAPIGQMTALFRRQEEKEMMVHLNPLTLIIRDCESDRVQRKHIIDAFVEEVGDLGDVVVTIHRYAIDPTVYSEVSYTGGGNFRMIPITVVKVWYYVAG